MCKTHLALLNPYPYPAVKTLVLIITGLREERKKRPFYFKSCLLMIAN